MSNKVNQDRIKADSKTHRHTQLLQEPDDHIVVQRYIEVPVETPLTTDTTKCGLCIDVMWVRGVSYDISNVTELKFCFAEHDVWCSDPSSPLEVDEQLKQIDVDTIKPGSIHVFVLLLAIAIDTASNSIKFQ